MPDASAHSEVIMNSDGTTTVRITRNYAARAAPTTAARVWQIVSNFGGIKTIFPSLLRVYLTYPDSNDTQVGTVRDMAFAPANNEQPLSPMNPLSLGIEQLVSLDCDERQLEYVSVLGLPVTGYKSTMQVTGEDACRLTWTSTFTPNPDSGDIAQVLAGILASGADQIAKVIGVP